MFLLMTCNTLRIQCPYIAVSAHDVNATVIKHSKMQSINNPISLHSNLGFLFKVQCDNLAPGPHQK